MEQALSTRRIPAQAPGGGAAQAGYADSHAPPADFDRHPSQAADGAAANHQDLLDGLSTHGTGRYERAIEASLEGIAADPDFWFAYSNLAIAYFFGLVRGICGY